MLESRGQNQTNFSEVSTRNGLHPICAKRDMGTKLNQLINWVFLDQFAQSQNFFASEYP